MKPITSRLVSKRKYGPDGQVNRHKARLVARGFQQEEGIDYEETFAAVNKASTSHLVCDRCDPKLVDTSSRRQDRFSQQHSPEARASMQASKGIDLPRGMLPGTSSDLWP